MRNILVIFIISLSFNCFAQYPILNDSIKNRGIYRSFNEFKNNKPSITLNYNIKVSSETIFGNWGKEKINFYSLDISKEQSKEIGAVYGFSDGTNFYITANKDQQPTSELPHKPAFYKLSVLAKYPYLEILIDNGMKSSQNGGVFIATSTARINLAVLFFETGIVKELTKSVLKEILVDKPELLEKFKKQENKNDFLKKYLIEYLKN